MALLFSAVTVTAGEDEVELLVGGIPREYDDLEGWSEFDDLMYFLESKSVYIIFDPFVPDGTIS